MWFNVSTFWIWEKARSRAGGLGRSCTFCSASGYCAAKVAFRAWNAWNGRVMSGLDSYGQLFQCYISTEISTNSGESNLPLHDSFFFRTLRDWFATICRFLEYHDLYVGAHLRISHAVYRWFSCELHWDCWGAWQVELYTVYIYIYIWDHSNMIQLEKLHISG